jgi:cytochrome P450
MPEVARTATAAGRPPRLPIGRFEAVREFRNDPIGLLERAAGEGDVAHFRAGPFQVYVLSHPDLVREVLVVRHRDVMKGRGLQALKHLLGEGLLTSEGEFHRGQRRTIQPIFHRDRILGYGASMVELADRAADKWRDGETVDIHQEMFRLTLAIVGRTLFATDMDGDDAQEVGEALGTGLTLFDRLMSPFAPVLSRLPLPSTRRLNRALARLDAVIYRMIEDRRAAGADGSDLLSMLLQARDEERDGGGMTDRQVRDEAMTIFLAGHETTSVALTWTWYLLSANPEAEGRLHAELDDVLGDRPPTVDDLPELPFAEQVLTEAMRLFPPAWVLGRTPLADIEVGGYRIPARSAVVASQWVIHRDPRWYEDPQAFRPERWTEDARSSLPRLAYFPFGAGPRICIGEPFAWMEGALLLATIARRWRMRMVPGHRIAVSPQVTLRPKHGMRMILERRA